MKVTYEWEESDIKVGKVVALYKGTASQRLFMIGFHMGSSNTFYLIDLTDGAIVQGIPNNLYRNQLAHILTQGSYAPTEVEMKVIV